ncbi:MAG: UDP-N-acetylmuramoyl-L-alanine--D-glutamate ligase [Clostridiales Family XIII bacterium]|jgi:UDP-N-acetylmuramoylalanine--D-glutamate ligase|nr:UDP-N-acetylmuramoyl-L-alanine--D-glutamate ligase [Clostridiales Family XIII bacterium]
MWDLKEKRLLIVGLGKSGLAAARVLTALGAMIWGYDAKDIGALGAETAALFGERLYAGGAAPDTDDIFDVLVMSPGVPPDLPFILAARETGAEIIGETELAFRLGGGRYIAITGTNGKTTTTTLIGEIFKNSGKKTEVVGNIGVPAITAALAAAESETFMVAELSSFQLETVRDFRPMVSVLLNITPDHMDRHKSMENYTETKARVFMNQRDGDFFVVNRDDGAAWDLALSGGCKAAIIPFSRRRMLDFGVFVADGRIVLRGAFPESIDVCGTDELLIPGAHNLENALAATAASWVAGIPVADIARSLRAFAGVEHRLELADVIDGVRFVNDSKGTNPDSSAKALDATAPGIFLIAGGYDKHADFTSFIDSFGGKVRRLLLMGATAEKIKAAAFARGFDDVTLCADMETCVETGFRSAGAGDTVLLSPACASWDMYSCFEERGEHFKRCVRGIRENA